jgi:hypothetical protein
MRRDDFVRVGPEQGRGTTRLFARSELWDFPDPERARSEGDFLGRLVSLFGAPDGDGFVLRHEPTALIVTAYAIESGPAYGGHHAEERADELVRVEDEWGANEVQLLATAETGEMPSLALLETRMKLRRRLLVLRAPRYAPVVEALETLIQAAPLTDYARIDDSGDAGPQRVGVEGGAPFRRRLEPSEALTHYLARLGAVARDADPATAFVAARLFSAFRSADEVARRPAVLDAWKALLDRVERLGGAPPARALWETLAEHVDEVGAGPDARLRLGRLEPPTG